MYRNPILYADYSDPDVIAVGSDFYMVASSFTYLPGVPILHSRDLVHWEIINYCVTALPFAKYNVPSHGSGTWAPSIRHHNGVFYVFIPLPDEGILVARSADIYGKFQLNLLHAAKGWIDPCPLWDEDGRAYMVFAYANSRCGKKHRLSLVEIDPACTRILGHEKVIFHEEDIAPTIEGPKLYKQDGWYYIFAPAGGVATGWQAVLRAKNIWGPYEYRVVMRQGSTAINGPHQGGWVTAEDGSHWFIHFQDVIELGRITHLQPMKFQDGWPVMGRNGEPVGCWQLPVRDMPHYRIATSDDFIGDAPGLQWQWQANPDPRFFTMAHPGLRLPCLANPGRENLLWYAPNALTQIPQALAFSATVKLRLQGCQQGDMAALGMVGHRYAYCGIEKNSDENRLFIRTGTVTGKEYAGEAVETLDTSLPYGSDTVYLRLVLREDKTYRFFWSSDGTAYAPIGSSFPLERCTWTGAKLCLWSANLENRPSEGYGQYAYFHIK